MTQFDDEVVPKSSVGWKNLHTDLSIATGTKLTLQNTGKFKSNGLPISPSIRVATGTTAPTSVEGFGALIHPGDNNQLESSPAAGDSTFVISENSSAEGSVAVET